MFFKEQTDTKITDMSVKKRAYEGLAYLLIILIASIPLMNDFLIRGHDIYFHLMRIEGLAEGLRAGDFPVRIQPVWYGGYGYAVSVFYSDLFLYPVALLRLFGLSIQNTYKCYVILCNIATVLAAGYSFGNICKSHKAGIVGSYMYALAPYRLVNLYTRGAMGEYTGMIFWPLLIYSCVLLLDEERQRIKLRKGAVLMGVSMAGMLQSHMLTAEIACMVLLLIMLIYHRRVFRKEVLIAGCGAVAVAVGLSMWFLVPFLDYMLTQDFNINSIRSTDIQIQRQGVLFSQIFAIFDNATGQSLDLSAGTSGDFTQGIGLALIASLFIFCGLCIFKEWRTGDSRSWRIAATAAGIGSLLVLMSTLYFPWDFISRVSRLARYIIVKIQFPWRFTGVAIGAFALVWGMVIAFIEKGGNKKRVLLAVTTGLLLLSLSDGHFMVNLLQQAQRIQIYEQADIDSFVASGEEYFLVNTTVDELETHESYQSDGLAVTQQTRNGIRISLHISNTTEQIGTLELPMLYYRGYQTRTDIGHVTVADGVNHILTLSVPAMCEGDIMVYFAEPWYWRVSELVTLAAAVFILCYCRKKIAGR